MGTLGGHVLPGAFFIIFGVWWSFVTSMRFILSNKKNPYKKNAKVGYQGTPTMPCLCLPTIGMRRAPIESWFKLIFAFIGLMGEVITGFHFKIIPQTGNIFKKDKSEAAPPPMHMHGHMHRRSVDNLPTVPVRTMYFAYTNTQHITMYLAFMLGQ